MMTAIYLMIALCMGGIGFMLGRTFPHQETVEKKAEEKRELTEAEKSNLRRAEREYMNFFSYDGDDQTKDIDG